MDIAGALSAGPMPFTSTSHLPAACAAGNPRPAGAHIGSPPTDSPECRPGPAVLSLPDLLALTCVKARQLHRRPLPPRIAPTSPSAPPPASPLAFGSGSLGRASLGGLFPSFKGLALLNAHMSGKQFLPLSGTSIASPNCFTLTVSSPACSDNGVEPGLLRHHTYGIHDHWGRSEYLFSDDVSALNTVLAAVDEFVTLCDGPLPSPWMSFDPLAYFTDLAREIGLPTVLDCRAKRLLPGPDGHVPLSPLPRFATRRPSRTNPPWCGMFAIFALRRLISPEDGLPPWLLILRCSCGESAPEVALHKGLNEAICPASAVEISIIALRSYS